MANQATDMNIQQLEVIEQQIVTALQSASQVLSELARDKPSIRQVESHSTAYIKAMDAIESGLATHINYLTQCSTGQPHEGSCYAAQNDLHMAHFRWEHVRSRLAELDKMKTEHIRQQSLHRAQTTQGKRVTGTQQQAGPQPQAMDTGGYPLSEQGAS